jgi:hypothetical protein
VTAGTERVDHAGYAAHYEKEALRTIGAANDLPLEYASAKMAEASAAAYLAQVHATLALVEQQRLGNLIAFAREAFRPEWAGYTISEQDGARGHAALAQAREGLGL